MTTRDFISNNFGVASTKDRQCSSVFADHDGNIYSYGYHYPLLFTVDGVTFRNCVGYSNTTAKHISWAGGQGAVDIWVSGCNQYSWRNPENVNKVPAILYHLNAYSEQDASNYKAVTRLKKAILSDLNDEIVDIYERLSAKKRTDTAIYRSLVAEHQDAVNRLATVKAAWGVA